MSKRNSAGQSLSDTIIIHDLRTAQNFLASYDCSPATIGIHNYLVRYSDNEQFIKFSHKGTNIKDFLIQLDEKEKSLGDKCLLDIERCAIIARLRRYLEQEGGSFQNILKQIQIHLHQSMQEDLLLTPPKTENEFLEQCQQRNENANELQQAHRMGRLQFHDIKPSMNIINLQNWILIHFQIFINIIPKSPKRLQWNQYLEILLNNSFLIIQHPSPPVATHSSKINGGITAKIHCRIVCLLDRSKPIITIDSITPSVHRLSTSYQPTETDTIYQQTPMNWKTYSFITTSNKYKIFSYADLSEISLKQSSIIKTHYAPFVYYIEFRINVTVRFPNDPIPYAKCITLKSAPFGLVSNTSQEEDLFARVFIEDLKSCKSLPIPLTTDLNNLVSPLSATDLTIEDIVNGIERYFIHQTGIRPKYWVMPYIEYLLKLACQTQSISIESQCHNCLVKILAQIDYMTKHPLLSLFHEDGLFLGICNDEQVNQCLLYNRQYCQKSICAIRFGAMNRMSDSKDIGIRIVLVEKSSNEIQRWKFDTTKLSMELGLYIIKIALCETSHFDNILTNIHLNTSQYNENILTNITTFVKLYHSTKLMNICPHKERYRSIWNHTYSDETITTTNNNNLAYNTSTIDQTQSHYHSNGTFLNVPQYFPSSQIIQTNVQPPPIIIVVTNPYNCIMSNQDVILLANNQLPEFSHLFQSSPIYRIDTDQRFNPNFISNDNSSNVFDN